MPIFSRKFSKISKTVYMPIHEGFRKENAENNHFFGLRRPEIQFSHYFVSENIFELLCLIFCVLNVQKLFRINENLIIFYENGKEFHYRTQKVDLAQDLSKPQFRSKIKLLRQDAAPKRPK